MGPETRPLSRVPAPVAVLLAAALAGQLAWHAWRPGPEAAARDLPPAPEPALLRVAALGEEPALARVLMLWLQAFDNQPGVSIPFRDLDYARLEDWLGATLDLDPRSRYPLLAAARLYGEVRGAPAKQRVMLEFVHRRFLEDPERRWPWLAHAALLARHRLGDLELALTYAEALAEHATSPRVPFWVRDMRFLLLEDLGELEAARVIVGGLLEGGQVEDPRELWFLRRKLRELEARLQAGGDDEISSGR